MDEKVLEEIRFHQDVVNKDANSPLYQIREKELEITGRVLAAKNQAEKLVNDARKTAQDLLHEAEITADKLAKKHSEDVVARAEQEAAAIRAGIEDEKAALRAELEARIPEASEWIVKAVTSA
ncbi:MAG: V-type ATPase subunit subunit G family protein [Coriobacteriales bacterium]|nr:hypothetical protein [Actinomycetes bacterium]